MRLTTSDLLISGWHNVCNEDGSWWVHPEHDFLLPFKKAMWVENSWRRFPKTKSNVDSSANEEKP